MSGIPKSKVPPVKNGDIVLAKIEGMAAKDPYMDYQNFIMFVKGAPPDCEGRLAKVRVTAVKATFAFVQYIEYVTPEVPHEE